MAYEIGAAQSASSRQTPRQEKVARMTGNVAQADADGMTEAPQPRQASSSDLETAASAKSPAAVSRANSGADATGARFGSPAPLPAIYGSHIQSCAVATRGRCLQIARDTTQEVMLPGTFQCTRLKSAAAAAQAAALVEGGGATQNHF